MRTEPRSDRRIGLKTALVADVETQTAYPSGGRGAAPSLIDSNVLEDQLYFGSACVVRDEIVNGIVKSELHFVGLARSERLVVGIA